MAQMKLTRSIRVKDDAGKRYRIDEYTPVMRVRAFNGAEREQIAGAGTLYVNGRVVNDLGKGRYQVRGTEVILRESR